MNEQLPPIDSNIREHLARRSAGRLPEGLAESVAAALDRAGAEEPRGSGVARSRVRWPRLRWTTPRLAGAGLGVALVAILVVTVGVPAVRNGPASGPSVYPADRALTTAELAAVMAGPALPAYTPLVATVTIDIRSDVCPMNRYPTVGVIEAAGSQICVMQGSHSPLLTGTAATGTFAFRYIGPGYLGLLGEITPASDSRLAFGASSSVAWPGSGKTFLVEGWLGLWDHRCPSDPHPSLDPIDVGTWPIFDSCRFWWLTDDPSAKDSFGPGGALEPAGSHSVVAMTMAQLDAVFSGGSAPVFATYIATGATYSWSDASPHSSFGYSAWQVLAKVPDLSVPEASPSESPSASASPSESVAPASPVVVPSGPLAPAPTGVVGSGGRPLTEAELAALWASDPTHLAGRLAIVKGPAPPAFGCQSWGAEPTGASLASPTCNGAVFDGQIGADGDYYAVRVGADGKLSIVGQIALSKTGFVFTLDQIAWPALGAGSKLAIVDAWLDWEPSLACDTPPYPSDSECGAGAVWSVLTSSPLEIQPMGYPDMQPPPSGVVSVDIGLGA
jgi:hypothetical protein